MPSWDLYRPVGEGKSLEELLDAAPKTGMGTTVVGLASSGGGSRAAYLTMAVLREIHRNGLRLNLPSEASTDRDLLDQIDYISAVSGGSLSAAYFVLNKEALQEPWDGRAWKDYSEKMTIGYRRRQWYWLGLPNPWSWIRSAFTNFNRGVIARDDYDNLLYRSATLADFPDRPSLAVSATDALTGDMYLFSNRRVSGESPIISQDLFYDRIDPRSVRVADAVYASSAFPFIYPVLALNSGTAGKKSMDWQQRFLADGGLRDNSGLATLHQQIAAEFYWHYRYPQSPTARLALALWIDASVVRVGYRRAYEWKGEGYAWRDTYLGQGRDSVGAAIDLHEKAVQHDLKMRGWIFFDHVDPILETLTIDYSPLQSERLLDWAFQDGAKALLLSPLIIALRLEDVPGAASRVDSHDPELNRLYVLAGLSIPRFAYPNDTDGELARAVANIQTDFSLTDKSQRILDLAAYILVQGTLHPRLREWEQRAMEALGGQK
jgi:predicted acylesterase/phospholipase RssA